MTQRGLKYLHSAGVIHRDLKPSDILINERCDIKICDFGLPKANFMTLRGTVPLRYRAPEVIFSWQKYGDRIDIWSAGCIFAEMLEGKPLFSGNGDNQYSDITELLGTPAEDVINYMNEEDAEFIRRLPKKDKVPISEKILDVDTSSRIYSLEIWANLCH